MQKEDPAELQAVIKLIVDLDELAQLILRPLRYATPWERALRAHVTDLRTCIQALRVAISLERGAAELAEDAAKIREGALQCVRSIAGTRATKATVAAVKLSHEIATSLSVRIADLQARSN